tara:strand:- start:186 stop:692 length:507 start_codon:yes stop_codon:yes gene_type:complete
MMKETLMGVLVTLTLATPAQAEKAEDSIECLAQNIYFEARSQSLAGQMAVGLVTRNRVLDKRFPNSFCEVVYQGPTRPSWKRDGTYYPVRHKCQFSWYCDGKADKIVDESAYQQAHRVATYIIRSKDSFDITDGATHYHAYYVKPSWAKSKKRIAKIEDHIFYTWKTK